MAENLRKLANDLELLTKRQTIRRWQTSTSRFVSEAPVFTVDEHDDVARKAFPLLEERPDMYWYWHIIDSTEDDIIVDKSRQNMISWMQRIAELKMCLFRQNFKAALIFDDIEEAKEHVEERTKFMFRNLPDWLRGRYKLGKRKGWFVVEECDGQPWGSFIQPIPRDPDMLRGKTFSWIVWEEMAKQSWAREAYKAVRPTIQGKRDPKTGILQKGRMFSISTPKPHVNLHTDLIGDPEVRDRAIVKAGGNIGV